MVDSNIPIHEDSVFQKGEKVAFREVDGEVLIVPIRFSTSDVTGVYRLNRTATVIWNLFDGHRPLSEIAGEVVNRFDVPREEAQGDIHELVADLLSFDALVDVTGK